MSDQYPLAGRSGALYGQPQAPGLLGGGSELPPSILPYLRGFGGGRGLSPALIRRLLSGRFAGAPTRFLGLQLPPELLAQLSHMLGSPSTPPSGGSPPSPPAGSAPGAPPPSGGEGGGGIDIGFGGGDGGVGGGGTGGSSGGTGGVGGGWGGGIGGDVDTDIGVGDGTGSGDGDQGGDGGEDIGGGDSGDWGFF
jgi:hypothetical protein